MIDLLPILLGVFIMLLYGCGDFLQAKGVRRAGVRPVAFWAMLSGMLSLVLVLVFLYASNSFEGLIIMPLDIALLILSGILGLLAILSTFRGMADGYVSITVTFANAASAITVVLGLFLLSEKLAALQLVGIALVILGTILVSLELRGVKKMKHGKLLASVKYGMLAMFGLGIEYLVIGYTATRLGWFLPAFIVVGVEGTCYPLMAVVRHIRVSVDRKSLAFSVGGSILLTAGFVVLGIGAALNYALIVTPILSASSMVTVILAFVLLKEKLSRTQVAGILIIVLGIAFISF